MLSCCARSGRFIFGLLTRNPNSIRGPMANPNPDPIPSKIRAAREAAGMSIAQLAVKADLAPTTLYFAERAPHLASKRTVDAVSKVLGLKPEQLR